MTDQTDLPDSPTDLEKRTWKYVARRSWREFQRDECLDEAAGLTFYAVLSIFPALIALLALVGIFGQREETADALEQLAVDLQLPSADEVLVPALEGLTEAQSGPGLAFVVSIAAALWSASGYVAAFGRAMNRIYEVREGRPFWKLRPLLLGVTLLGIALTAIIGLALVVSGPVARAIGAAVGLDDTVVTIWDFAKWPLILLAIMLVIAILYYATPNVRQPTFRWVSIGAAFAILVWILGTLLLTVYVGTFASYDRVYGSLAGVVVLLLWLWLTNIALLFGAELDSEIERGRELQGGVAAEQALQLPHRDTSGLEKQESQDRNDVAEGRQIREDS